MRSLRRLLVVSHVLHYRHGGKLYAYGPYAREIDVWAELFPELVIAAPCRDEQPPGDWVAFTRANISIAPQREAGGDHWSAKMRQILILPLLVRDLSRAMRAADAIHVRCPGNLGLLGVLLAPLFSHRLVAKYAGQWNGYPGERFALRLQRGVLRSRWWRGPVTVYGDWPNEPRHVIAFFTSMMTSQMVKRATEVAKRKTIGRPLRVLFSGRLAKEKRVGALLEAAAILVERGIVVELALVGGGTEESALRKQAEDLGLHDLVEFVGSVPFEASLRWYEWAHCLVLPSANSEGWPKAIAEGMCYGLVCLGVEHGQVPRMLEGRGIVVKTGTPLEIADALQRVAERPGEFEDMRREASMWARQYSLDGLREALRELLDRHWDGSVSSLKVTQPQKVRVGYERDRCSAGL
ncbi:MAG TPA: glycosyltransferase [Verrucomicrobiae bacterium]|nr:glycosyltransferase [Verrucomicrobiae bacterium]